MRSCLLLGFLQVKMRCRKGNITVSRKECSLVYSNAQGALRIYNIALVAEIEHNFLAIMEYVSHECSSAHSVLLNSLFSI